MAAPADGTPPSSTVQPNRDTPSIYLHTTEKRLLKISHQIEWLDTVLHGERCRLPTVTELALYMLIHRHVNLYIQLFQSEQIMAAIKCCSRRIGVESTHSDKKMHSSKSNMAGSSRPAEVSLDDLLDKIEDNRRPAEVSLDDLLDKMEDNRRPAEVSLDDLQDKMEDNRRHLSNISVFLRKCRNSLSQSCVYPLKFAIEDIKLTDIDDKEGFEMMESHNTSINSFPTGLNDHENVLDRQEKSACSTDNDIGKNLLAGDKTIDFERFLRCIIHELLDIGRSRSYSPPSEIEIEHYRNIRIRICSSLAYARAKTFWHPPGRRVGKNELISIGEHDYEFHLEYYPRSHMLANTLDYLPGILSLLQECTYHASSCSSSFYKYIKGQEHGSLYLITKEQEEFGLKVCPELEVYFDLEKDKKELFSTANFPTEDNNSTFCKSMTRTDCLLEMLDMFEKLKSSFTTMLSVEDVRLLAQIDEHVNSSLWLFRLLKSEHPAPKVQVVDTQKGELRNREDYLRKITALVEAIRRSFLDIPPNNDEEQLYKKLQKYVSDAFINTDTRALIKGKKRKMDDYAPCDQDYLDDLIIDVCSWHLKWVKKVEGEFVNMLKAVLPSFCRGFDLSDNSLELISEKMKAMLPEVVKMLENELPDSAQQKLKLLDECPLMLFKAKQLVDAVRFRLNCNISRIDSLSFGNLGMIWDEVCNVCQVMSRSNI